jgi:hypothetical protein
MSEKLHSNHEAGAEHLDLNAESKRNLEKTQEAGREARNEVAEQLDAIQQSVETQAISGKEISVGDREGGNTSAPTFAVHQELKRTAYKRSLRKVQSQLNPVERNFSRIIHQPVIDKASELAGKTIARPQGILFGGIFACLGSVLFLYFTKHYGFSYNYLVFLLLFVGGYAFGLVVDMIRLAFKRS